MAPAGRIRVKICGITRPEDAAAAAAAGADAIGLVFHAPSPRAVTAEQAGAVVAALPPFVTAVGLFVDPEPAAVQGVLAAVPLDVLQFHGGEPPELCAAFGRPWLKAVRMRPGTDLHAAAARYAGARGLLVDTYRPGMPGGTGETFDWSEIPPDLARPLILAGGLTPENVGEALARVAPAAVDVSGGVERARGIKDPSRVAAFVREVHRVQTC